jgi:hypothetical protein
MKLHEAIVKILANGQSMTIYEIAEKLNSNNWYKKKDGSLITAFQIHGRTKNYSHIFKRKGTIVSLYTDPPFSIAKSLKKPLEPSIRATPYNISVFESYLLNKIYFKPAHSVDGLVPVNKCGLYCISINNVNALPESFRKILIERNHNMLYIGIATKCLNKRLLNQELRIKGHGTFIRSVGAILGFKPLKGSLLNRKNKINYVFSDSDNQSILKWINENLWVNWIEFTGDFHTVEEALINAYSPLLNISKNKMSVPELIQLRTECIRIANS